jgi:hypothetical protein
MCRIYLTRRREGLPPLLRCPQKELTVNPMTFLLRHGNCFQGLDAASESKVEKGSAPSLHSLALSISFYFSYRKMTHLNLTDFLSKK